MGLMKRIHTGRLFGQPIPAGVPRVPVARLPGVSRAPIPVEAAATAVRPTIADEAGSGEPALRPLWYLMPGGMPVPAKAMKRGNEPSRWCREGDKEWRRIDEI